MKKEKNHGANWTLFALSMGSLSVGEVKDNVGGFTANNFESLSQICEAICPDVALLVFMEGDFNAKSMFAQKLEDLQRRLAPQTNVEWRKVPVSW